MRVRMPLVVFLPLLVTIAFAGAACGSAGTEERSLPPNDFEELADIFDAELEPLGLKLTRGALIDTRHGRYRPSDTGRHLAVYVEPTGEYTAADYAEGIVPSARAFLPEVFERWDELETFDVCQEPLPGVDDRKEPPPVTQLNLSRAESRDIDWTGVTLAELLAAREPTREGYTLYVAPAITSDPSWPARQAG
ncbi:MAG: hypothetical protein ACT4PI_09645 [Actinomycetota bacterium]